MNEPSFHQNTRAWIQALPKAELHLHIEGTLEPELMFTLAEKNKIQLPYQTPEEIKRAYQFKDLQSFLDLYIQGAGVLQTAEDFYELAMQYFTHAAADGVVKSELFFAPQIHTERGIAFEVVMDGLNAAQAEAKRRFQLPSSLILCFLRHLSEEQAFETFEKALPFKNHIIGFGLESSEKNRPPILFKTVFERIRQQGFRVVAHAGEEGPADYIWQALHELKAERIDHGVRCLEDDTLVEYLREKQIPLTVCPFSNIKLRVFDTLEKHPLKIMLEKGLHVTVNSDDPSYFGGYVLDNLVETAKALQLSQLEIETLCRNSLSACFV